MNRMDTLKEVRDRTSISMTVCKQALEACSWDIDQALKHIQEKGLGKVDRGHKTASEGQLVAYVHAGSKLAVLVEVNVETDFAAKSEAFKTFAENVAMQIAATDPRWVSRDDIHVEEEKVQGDIFLQQARTKLGPKASDAVLEKMVSGKMQKWYAETCLLSMPAVMCPDKTIGQMLDELSAQVREKVVVKRFVRWTLGDAR